MVSMEEVMSSTRETMNLGAICGREVSREHERGERKTYSRCPTIKVIQILIERITVYLNRDNLLRRRMRDTERFLKTFEHAFAILVWILASTCQKEKKKKKKKHVRWSAAAGTKQLTALAPSPSSFSLPPSGPSPSPSPSPSSAIASCHHK